MVKIRKIPRSQDDYIMHQKNRPSDNIFTDLPKLPVNMISALTNEVGKFLRGQNSESLGSANDKLIERKNVKTGSIDSEEDSSNYARRLSHHLKQGRKILEDSPRDVSNIQLESFKELQKGLEKFYQAEVKEVNKLNSEEILFLFEESQIHFQHSVRLALTSRAGSSFSGGGSTSGRGKGSSDSFSGGGRGNSGGSSSGGSSGGGGNGDSAFFFEEDDPFEGFLSILRWIREQAVGAKERFLETVKVVRAITTKVMLRAASIIFRSAREDIRSQETATIDLPEDEINVKYHERNRLEGILSIEERINQLEEEYDRKNKNIVQEVKIYIDTIQSLIMSNNSESENPSFDLRQSGDTYNVVQSGATGKYARSDNNTFVQSEQKQTLAEAAAEIQRLLKQLEQTNPNATEIDRVTYVNDETTPSFKRRVVGALQAGGEAAIEEFLDNPYVNVSKAVVKGWIKPE
jgi:hypothetical protein